MTCRGCKELLDPANFDTVADGCQCNSPRGINHGIVPEHTCVCEVCDAEGTGVVRPKKPTWRDRPPLL